MGDSDNGGNQGGEPTLLKTLVDQVVGEAHQRNQDGRRFANNTFTAVDDKQFGVLQRMMKAVDDTRNYRQALKTANWKDRFEAAKAVAAIHERFLCGVDITPILDRIEAESAGVNSAKLSLIIQGLTHTVIDTNYNNPMQKEHWFNRGKKKDATNTELVG